MGITQNELAKHSGLSLKTISNIERGKDVKFSMIISVLRSLNILENLDGLVPEAIVRPIDYLLLDKSRQRVRKKTTIKKNGHGMNS